MSEQWIIALLPFVIVVFGVIGYFWLRHESHKLDREFGPDRRIGEKMRPPEGSAKPRL